MSDDTKKRNPEQLPRLLKELLNSEGYDTLRQAIEASAKKIKEEMSENSEDAEDDA